MIKGCSRRVIVIKHPESELFEEAYFIVNPKKSERRQSDLLAEASRIISQRTTSAGRACGRARLVLLWLVGFASGIGAAVPIACFLM
ncbi:MAG: hypothetical protein IKU43_04770 [Clostridia bacterium]|nr:hypothetical protein [Clostridia bacterium]